MILETFRNKFESERGAVEFIEGSIVITVILLLISLLIMISMLTISTIRDGELIFQKVLEQIYLNDGKIIVNSFKDNQTIEITSKNGAFYTNSKAQIDGALKAMLSRVDTESLLRKIDLADEILSQINDSNGNFSGLGGKISQYKEAFSKFAGTSK